MAVAADQVAAAARALQCLRPWNQDEISLSGWSTQFDEVCMINGLAAEPPAPPAPNNDELPVPPHNLRRAVFLAAIGHRYYEVLRQCCLPGLPNMFPIPNLLEFLKERFEPAGLQQTSRYHFYARCQQDGESAVSFIHALQTLADKCGFGQQIFDALRDRVVQGIRDPNTRLKLLEAGHQDFFAVRAAVIQAETIQREARALAQNNVHHVSNTGYRSSKKKQKSNPTKPNNNPNQERSNGNGSSNGSNGNGNKKQWDKCRRCNRYHDWRTCVCKDFTCFKCNKKGHISKACDPERRGRGRVNAVIQQQPQQSEQPQPQPQVNTNAVFANHVDNEVDSLFRRMNLQC